MTSGWLIYDAPRLEVNRWMASHYIEVAARHGLHLEIVMAEDLPAKLPDFAIMRCINVGLSARLEAAGVRVFNTAQVAEIANDKAKAVAFAARLGIPTLPTVAFTREQVPDLDYPVVVKTADGCGGTEVELIDSARGLSIFDPSRKLVAQPLCDTPGVDYRVYVVGGRPFHTILRTQTADFRSNFSLGGAAESAPCPEEIAAYVDTIVSALPLDFAGVDFLPHAGGYVFNEIEDVVGARMLYDNTDRDVIDAYLAHITEVLS